MSTQLQTIVIRTTRMADLASWYADALGLGEWECLPGHMGQRVGAMYFGLDQVDDIEGTTPSAVTCWFHVDDLEGTFARLEAAGTPVRQRPTKKPWGDTLASVLDPDGNIVGLAQAR